jgi:tryptophanyl-tRNA synthetase
VATQTILTGLQPSGELHIGNYVTAIAPLLEMQEKYECLLFVADLHAMTVPYKAEELRLRTLDLVRIYLAAGVDPEKCLVFLQSQVPQHAELMWILSTQLPMAELERMTQYKEKSAQGKGFNLGLFAYPALMAADILLYDVDLVPVGQDQVQHVELARVAARKFNKSFGETFKLPKSLVNDAARIIGLDGQGKMSKSLGNALPLLAPPEEIRKKIRKAVVNPERPTEFEGKRPITVFEWHDSAFPSEQTKQLSQQCHLENRNCEGYKELVAKNIANHFAPLREKYAEFSAKGDEWLLRLLESNSVEARARAARTMQLVRKNAGLF